MRALSKAELLTELRSRIRRIEGIAGEGGRLLPLGDVLDHALPDGGLPLGCLHEVIGGTAGRDDPLGGAVTGFAAALASLIAARHGPAIWLVRKCNLYAPGLAALGLSPECLIVVEAQCRTDLLWATEEVLRCRGVGVVLAETGAVDLTVSRRLQLAAEASGVTAILLSSGRARLAASAAVTRWAVAPVPSRVQNGEPGVGEPCWSLRLLRCRGGRSGEWLVEWRDGGLAAAPVSADVSFREAVPAIPAVSLSVCDQGSV